MAASETKTTACGRVDDDADWRDALAEASLGGSFARPPAGYARKLAAVLGIAKFADSATTTFEDLLGVVCASLHRAHGSHRDVVAMCGRRHADPPRPVNVNFAEWCAALEDRLPSEPRLHAVVADAIAADATDAAAWKRRARQTLGPGWDRDLEALFRYARSRGLARSAA